MNGDVEMKITLVKENMTHTQTETIERNITIDKFVQRVYIHNVLDYLLDKMEVPK